MVLPAPRLAELGFIPKNSDAAAATVVDARAALRAEHAVLMLVSHRWLRPREGEPDYAEHTKARALVAFARWYELKYPARRLFFWIDFACIPYDNRSTGIAALPAFVAACTDMLCFETPDYHRRAWCRLGARSRTRSSLGRSLSLCARASSGRPAAAAPARGAYPARPARGRRHRSRGQRAIELLLAIAEKANAAEAWGGAPAATVWTGRRGAKPRVTTRTGASERAH